MGKQARGTNKQQTYITGFDGLRTIGVLLVIFYHLNPEIFPGGYLGVPIFMVLSGYLITGSLLREIQNTGHINYRSFFVRRAKRLYPALVTMIFTSSTYILLFQRNLLSKLWQIVLTNLTYVYNWWQIFNGQSYFERFANNESPFTHLWTLSIEGQFYLIWPFVFVLLFKLVKSNGKRSVVAIALAAISAMEMAFIFSPTNINRVYYGTDTRAFSILLGCALAFVWPINRLNRNLNRESKILIDSCGFFSALVMIVMIFAVRDQSAWLYQGGMLIFSIFATILIASIAHPGGSFNRIFTTKFSTFIGKISYGVYIYQFPVMIFFENKFKNLADHPILYPLIEIILICIISILSYVLIEQYFAKITWKQFQKDIKQIFQFKNQKPNFVRGKVGLIILIPMIVVGLCASIYSSFAKTKDANDSPLAREIKINAKKQRIHNRKAEIKARRENEIAKKLEKNKSASRSVKRAERKKIELKAKKNPVNTDLEKYGLTQIQLQLAQDLSLTAIGDSVMLDGQPILTKIFPKVVIDAVVSRQASGLPDILRNKINQGVVAPMILIGLGTNGTLTPDIITQTMELATPQRDVFWINDHVPLRSWQDSNNAVLEQEAKKYRNMHVIDWHHYVATHQEWLYDDLTHPNQAGSLQYGTFVAKNILQKVEKK